MIMDITVPNVNLVSPISNVLLGTKGVVLLWNKAIDNISGISNYDIQISSNRFTGTNYIFKTDGAGNISFTVSSLSEVTNWWRVGAVDKVSYIGN